MKAFFLKNRPQGSATDCKLYEMRVYASTRRMFIPVSDEWTWRTAYSRGHAYTRARVWSFVLKIFAFTAKIMLTIYVSITVYLKLAYLFASEKLVQVTIVGIRITRISVTFKVCFCSFQRFRVPSHQMAHTAYRILYAFCSYCSTVQEVPGVQLNRMYSPFDLQARNTKQMRQTPKDRNYDSKRMTLKVRCQYISTTTTL